MTEIRSLEQILEWGRAQLAAKEIIESNSLKEAKQYVEDKKAGIKKEDKPLYHLTGEVGWMNDPNGFSYFDGEYHLFYQYHPFSTNWGPMHWGHGVTKDFIKWEQRPIAIAPDENYDSEGCFSGSAIQVEDLHILLYTGHKDAALRNNINRAEHEQSGGTSASLIMEPDSPVRQVQCVAIGDGTNYIKVEDNPVIGLDQVAKNASLSDFRDPKVWKKDNVFYMVLGSRHEDGDGQILLYKSENLIDWSYVGPLSRSNNEIGRMWECPDLFELDGKDVLIMSPQEMEKEEHRFHNGNATTYMIGELDYTTGQYSYDSYDEIDYGLDFYAPQTLDTPDGRRIMVAWMQSWDRPIPSSKMGWAGAMTIPRELKIVDGKLIQFPVRELKNYRKNETIHSKVSVKNEIMLEGIKGRQIELEVEVALKEASRFEIKVMKGQDVETNIIYNAKEEVLTFNRTNAEDLVDGLNIRSMPLVAEDNKIKLTILMDTFSVEIFANEGKAAMSSTAYTNINSDGISFSSDLGVVMDIKKWDIIL